MSLTVAAIAFCVRPRRHHQYRLDDVALWRQSCSRLLGEQRRPQQKPRLQGRRNVTSYNVNTGALSAIDDIRQDIDIATVRVNYRFGGPVVARY
jgi:hypothetical protein